jgi:hypothetical protein
MLTPHLKCVPLCGTGMKMMMGGIMMSVCEADPVGAIHNASRLHCLKNLIVHGY